MTMSSGQRTVLWVAGVLASTLLILAFALIPLEASEYSAAFAAIQAIFTVVTIGVAAFVFVGQREQTTRALELADAQVKVTEDGIRRDHDRRRKEATLEYVGRMNDNTKDARRQLHEWSSGAAISREQADDLRENGELLEIRRCLREVLNEYERLALGCRDEIYDVVVVARLIRQTTTKIVRQYEPFIQLGQVNNIHAYEHLVWLVEEMAKVGPPTPPLPPRSNQEQASSS